jgi:hypothetical protein
VPRAVLANTEVSVTLGVDTHKDVLTSASPWMDLAGIWGP